MTAAVGFDEPAPLYPYEARAKLLIAVWLLAELGANRTSGARSSTGKSSPTAAAGSIPRPARRRSPVRPPRAC